MWQIWFAALAASFGLALWLHEWSVRRRFRKIRAEQQENRALDTKIYRLYNEIEEMLDSFEAYVGEVHDEMELRRNELVAMSRQATTLYMQVMQPDVFAPKPQIEDPPPPETPRSKRAASQKETAEEAAPPKDERSKLTQRDRGEMEKLSGKGRKIRFLMGKGLNIGEVARELNIGKGEIRLILDLDKD